MAADDDKNEAPDPWADLVADDLGANAEPLPDGPVSEEQTATDDDVGAWLAAMDGDSADAGTPGVSEADVTDAAPPLSVFAPEEQGAEPASQSGIEIGTGFSGIEIGTGFSGIDMSAGDGGSQAETATEGLQGWTGLDDAESPAARGETDACAAAPDAVETGFGVDADDAEASETDEPTVPFEAAVSAAAAAAATVAKPRSASVKPRAKGGGLGPMIGVVAGGVMAIPITMAILIWGFQRDPFGIAKQVPESMAFLLPQKFQPGFKKRPAASPDAPAAASLDDLAAATVPAADAPSTDATEPAADVAPQGDPPAAEPGTEPALPDAALVAVDPLAAVADAAPKPDAPDATAPEPSEPLFPDPEAPAPATPDPLAAAAAAPSPPSGPALPAAVEPAAAVVPPLDVTVLETALAEAATALEAAAAAEDYATIAGKKSLVGWYKSLARTAEELVKLENEAADSGRPLEGTQERLAELHADIAAQDAVAATLPQLARDWLAYGRRDSAGILLPVTFDSAEQVGPYWRSKVRLGDGDDVRELSIITREEPAAVAGDKLLVIGIVFDGDVIWAADVRPAAAEPATVTF